MQKSVGTLLYRRGDEVTSNSATSSRPGSDTCPLARRRELDNAGTNEWKSAAASPWKGAGDYLELSSEQFSARPVRDKPK